MNERCAHRSLHADVYGVCSDCGHDALAVDVLALPLRTLFGPPACGLSGAAWERLMGAMAPASFSRRLAWWERLQIAVSGRAGMPEGARIAWPDVLLHLTDADVAALLEREWPECPKEHEL